MPKRDVAVKLPSHRLGSAGTLALYGMTDGGKGSVEMSILPVGSKLVGAASRGACGLEGGREVVSPGIVDRRGRGVRLLNVYVTVGSDTFSIVNFRRGGGIIHGGERGMQASSVCS